MSAFVTAAATSARCRVSPWVIFPVIRNTGLLSHSTYRTVKRRDGRKNGRRTTERTSEWTTRGDGLAGRLVAPYYREETLITRASRGQRDLSEFAINSKLPSSSSSHREGARAHAVYIISEKWTRARAPRYGASASVPMRTCTDQTVMNERRLRFH